MSYDWRTTLVPIMELWCLINYVFHAYLESIAKEEMGGISYVCGLKAMSLIYIKVTKPN